MDSKALRTSASLPATADRAGRLRLVTDSNRRAGSSVFCEPEAQISALPTVDGASSGVNFRPGALAKRRTAAWRGGSGEVVQITGREAFESRYCGSFHLLIVYRQAARRSGETIIEGLPRSTLHQFSDKLTFVPSGRSFREWQEPRISCRAIYLYIDPLGPLLPPESAFASAVLKPRLFFDSPVLRQTGLKLEALIESSPSASQLYAEAVTSVLAYELLRINSGATLYEPPVRGGLAARQQRLVAEYIEEHVGKQISLAELAELAQLSIYHFARAFKHSFGLPPHRYHTSRRIERARALLAKPNLSVTEIALDLGFSDASSFTATFHKLVGRTPTDYRRSFF
jgi:AraC family transcriptional regulator